MRKVTLNGWFMSTKEKAHRHLKQRLHLPEYYGCNLDALNDCLTEIGEPTEITLRNAYYMKKHLGAYGGKLISVLIAATGENPKVQVCLREDRWFFQKD